MHTKSIDGPCEIHCNGETGGIYYLRNHGLKLYFPPKCPQQNIEIVFHIYLPDKSPIKPGLQIASAVFKFRSNIKLFDKAVTLTILRSNQMKISILLYNVATMSQLSEGMGIFQLKNHMDH